MRRGARSSGSTRCSSPRTARTAASARSRRIGSGSSRSEPDWRSMHRARGRAAPGGAGGDAARHVRPDAAARPGGEFHAVLGAQGRAGENHWAESSVPRREQRHRLDAGRAQAGHGRGSISEAKFLMLWNRPATLVMTLSLKKQGSQRSVFYTRQRWTQDWTNGGHALNVR